MNIPRRAYAQYREKPKFMAWLEIAHKLGGSIESASEAVRKSYDIDKAEGEVLNVIGRIVVVDRGFISDIPLGQVSFAEDEDAPQFGDVDAMMSEETAASDSTMSDEIFRIAIKAKINKNNGDATIPSILRQVNNLIPTLGYVAVVEDSGDMSFNIEFQGEVSNILRWALFNADLIQRPAGVQFNGFQELTDVIFFGDEDAMFTSFDDVVFAPV